MNEREVAIKIRCLSKTFMIRDDRKFSLKELFASLFNQGRTKKYVVLNNLNLDIYKGEFFGIIGGNGSGKSTLLKLIARIYEGDKGSKIEYAGRLVPFLELGVGFNAELTGRENIFLNGTILGMTIDYLKSVQDEIIDFAEIREYIDMPVKNYSSGMMVRLAFSIAIKSNADIYLLDEVLTVGDERFQQKSSQVIDKLRNSGKTIVYVSHSMEAVMKYCDRALLLERGGKYTLGTPAEVIAAYRSRH